MQRSEAAVNGAEESILPFSWLSFFPGPSVSLQCIKMLSPDNGGKVRSSWHLVLGAHE